MTTVLSLVYPNSQEFTYKCLRQPGNLEFFIPPTVFSHEIRVHLISYFIQAACGCFIDMSTTTTFNTVDDGSSSTMPKARVSELRNFEITEWDPVPLQSRWKLPHLRPSNLQVAAQEQQDGRHPFRLL
jgi:hypothetical protein